MTDKVKLLALVDQLRLAILDMGAPAPEQPVAKPITSVAFENTGGDQVNVPVTWGQVFAPGELPVGHLIDGAQTDIKATHPDGSTRHAVLTRVLPKLAAGEKQRFDLVPVRASPALSPDVELSDLRPIVTIKLGGETLKALPAELTTWLSGASVTELKSVDNPHPHLSVRFAERYYHATNRVRVDITIENDWAYEPNPQNFTYDVEISVGGKVVYSQKNLTHYHHARWRHVAWVGEEPKVHVRHDIAHLIATRAIPNYDQSVRIKEADLAALAKSWAKADKSPMGTGLLMRAMATTGGRSDIGILPGWSATWLLSMDPRAAEAVQGTADRVGSFPMHYRDQDTGQPISLIDHPYMTLVGNPGDTYNPATKLREAFPSRIDKEKVPNIPDVSHHPGLAYLPYLLAGDAYYLEELQFWASYCAFSSNPGYRENIKGLLKPEQVRGQAWALRTIAQAAYITPDTDRLKSHFNQILDSNLDWYNAEYTDNPKANKLGVLVNGYAVVYQGKTGVGPWQDDFFTQAVGHAAELGFEKARKLLKWKAQFAASRMLDGCWVHGAIYSVKVRDTSTSPFYETWPQALQATDSPDKPLHLDKGCGTEAQAKALGLQVGEMTGYADGATGYPSNMQPALAYAADVLDERGKKAWRVFDARTVKPDYSRGPQFAIVPRDL